MWLGHAFRNHKALVEIWEYQWWSEEIGMSWLVQYIGGTLQMKLLTTIQFAHLLRTLSHKNIDNNQNL